MHSNADNKIKLQVNNSGAWKDVILADSSQIEMIKDAAAALCRLAKGRLSFRIINMASTTCAQVLLQCEAPSAEWQTL